MFNRRDFLKLSGAGAMTASLVPGARLAFGEPQSNTYDTLLVVFLAGLYRTLRGGKPRMTSEELNRIDLT